MDARCRFRPDIDRGQLENKAIFSIQEKNNFPWKPHVYYQQMSHAILSVFPARQPFCVKGRGSSKSSREDDKNPAVGNV